MQAEVGFDELLRHLMDQRRLSGAELARRLGGRNPSVVTRWRNGEDRPRPHAVAKIAAVLEVDPRFLLRAAGYLPVEDVGEQVFAPQDPRLLNVIHSWTKLPESVRDVMNILAEARVSAEGIVAEALGVSSANGAPLQERKNWLLVLLALFGSPTWSQESPALSVPFASAAAP